MRLYVDLDTLAVSDYSNAALASMRAKRSDRFSVELKFTQGGITRELPSGATGRIVIKRVLDFSGYPIAWAPAWRKVGFGPSVYYLMRVNLHTQQVEDQFLTLSGELTSISTALEIQWEHRGTRRTSQSVPLTIENDYVRLADEEEIPVPLIDLPTAPVISLIGASVMNVALGSVFVDPGATVVDNYDAPRTVFSDGVVNMASVGSYTLTYRALDAAENPAVPVTRSVIVSDMTAPVITLIGANVINLVVGATFTDPGANVADNLDAARVISGVGLVNTTLPGAYTLTYSAADAAGNVATPVTRSVIVSDVVAPVIALIGANPLIVPLNSVFVDPGANVTDDVSFVGVVHQVFGTGAVDTAILGTYTLTYSVTDAAGNVATPVTRSVIVSDVVAPVIALIGSDPVNLNVGDVFTDDGANVTDDVDAARVISGVGSVNAALHGTYTFTYSATDAAGNVATPVTRSVIVSDVVAPVITLIGADPVNLNVGDVFTDDGANVTDDVDVARVISGTVLSPTLIFKGSYDNGYAYAYNDAVLYSGKFYYRHSNPSNPGYPPDPTVTANASWTMVTDIANTGVAGTYVLTYAATDAAGNVAAPVTRSVIVS